MKKTFLLLLFSFSYLSAQNEVDKEEVKRWKEKAKAYVKYPLALKVLFESSSNSIEYWNDLIEKNEAIYNNKLDEFISLQKQYNECKELLNKSPKKKNEKEK